MVELDARSLPPALHRGSPASITAGGVSSSLKMRSEDAMRRLQDVVLLAQVLNRPEEAQPVLQERHHHPQRQRAALCTRKPP